MFGTAHVYGYGSALWATFLCFDKFEPFTTTLCFTANVPERLDMPAIAVVRCIFPCLDTALTAIAGMSSRSGTLAVKQRVVVKGSNLSVHKNVAHRADP